MHPLEHEESADPRLAEKLLEMISSSWIGQVVSVTAELGLADLLRDGPRSSADLANATSTDAPSLHQLLRALTTIGLCTESEDGRFAITSMGALLGTDSSNSLRCWSMWWGKYLWPVWGNLIYSVRTGKSARTLLTGTEGFRHLESDSAAAATFNGGLAELTRLIARSVVQAYDFSKFRCVADIGGGYGELLAAILLANSAAHGILFDLPHAADGAKQHLARAGLRDRCEFVAGDFFQAVPRDADAYVLKSVIHDWNDEKSREILQTCRRAMSDDSRLLLVERVLPTRLEISAAHQAAARSDLNMLVALAAKERTEGEFRRLLEAAGFELTRVCPAGIVSVLEATRR